MSATTETASLAPGNHATTRPWRRAALWLSCLAPLFFLSYGLANWLAAQRPEVGSVVFSWEHNIPFLAWTIIPYWSSDALYGLSLFICRSRTEVDILGKRLLSAQIVAVLCFIVLPLSFTFDRPQTDGLHGALFAMLEGFDRPYNQAPSLHIALLVILWMLYAKHIPQRWCWLLHAWFVLIGGSVLTTYQHHFVDVPTGALLGWCCVWLWPEEGPSPFAEFRLAGNLRRWLLAIAYATGSALVAVLAFALGGAALWLLWPAISLLLVAMAYAGLGAAVFQKAGCGRMSLSAQWLLAPYLVGAWVNSRLWTRANPAPSHVLDGVWIGRLPSASDVAERNFASIVDLTAEMPAPLGTHNWQALPSLDLIPKVVTVDSYDRIYPGFG